MVSPQVTPWYEVVLVFGGLVLGSVGLVASLAVLLRRYVRSFRTR